VIVVVGIPAWRPAADEPGRGRATGRPVRVARAAVASGARVELVGKVGDDPDGDRLLIDLARTGVGHVAVLREPGTPTRTLAAVRSDDGMADPTLDGDIGPLVTMAVDDAPAAASDGRSGRSSAGSATTTAEPVFEPADLQLALRYLVDFRVIVLADPLAPAAIPVVVDAAAFADARIVAVAAADAVPELPDLATVLEPPAADDDAEFDELVGAFAAALDQGEPPEEAFRSATAARGWETAGGPG
jgi:sugar/nucleoside kinase (ribokinase family)